MFFSPFAYYKLAILPFFCIVLHGYLSLKVNMSALPIAVPGTDRSSGKSTERAIKIESAAKVTLSFGPNSDLQSNVLYRAFEKDLRPLTKIDNTR